MAVRAGRGGARYVAGSAPADVPAESLDLLRHLPADYDRQVRDLPPAPPKKERDEPRPAPTTGD
ncbi:hypothetical protein [Kitasatospora atroaurantiaca]|nr:hypothetical protein [Kitasatospora atroaurantiaca]